MYKFPYSYQGQVQNLPTIHSGQVPNLQSNLNQLSSQFGSQPGLIHPMGNIDPGQSLPPGFSPFPQQQTPKPFIFPSGPGPSNNSAPFPQAGGPLIQPEQTPGQFQRPQARPMQMPQQVRPTGQSPTSQFQRVSPGMYRGPNGQIVRSTTAPTSPLVGALRGRR